MQGNWAPSLLPFFRPALEHESVHIGLITVGFCYEAFQAAQAIRRSSKPCQWSTHLSTSC